MGCTFGPVPSRRLGRSLGVDIVPFKTCTYDCVYCQLGRTTHKTLDRRGYVEPQPVVQEVRQAVAAGTPIDYITFSGSGEPTLNADLGAMIRQVKADTAVPVAVLTNGSLLHLEEVRRDLEAADLVVPSLDAASGAAFERVNRPAAGLAVEQVLSGLKQFRRRYAGALWLEVMLVAGVNDDEAEVARLVEAAREIAPDRVQLNTVVRPPADADALPLSEERMQVICARFGERAEIIAPFDNEGLTARQKDLGARILEMVLRRPCTLADISSALGAHRNEALKLLAQLMTEGRIKERTFGRQRYYEGDHT